MVLLENSYPRVPLGAIQEMGPHLGVQDYFLSIQMHESYRTLSCCLVDWVGPAFLPHSYQSWALFFIFYLHLSQILAQTVKNLPMGLIPGLGRSPGEGNGYPLQYSCLENLIDRGAWRATVHGVAKSQTRLRTNTFTFTAISARWFHLFLAHLPFLPCYSETLPGPFTCLTWYI